MIRHTATSWSAVLLLALAPALASASVAATEGGEAAVDRWRAGDDGGALPVQRVEVQPAAVPRLPLPCAPWPAAHLRRSDPPPALAPLVRGTRRWGVSAPRRCAPRQRDDTGDR